MKNFLRTLVTALAFIGLALASDASVTLDEVERTIDLSTQLVKINHKLTFSATTETKFVNFLVEENLKDKVAFLEAKVRVAR